MKYYKNIEISKKYGVNPTTVQNWINASLEGKNNLRLTKVKDRDCILINEQNRIELESLTEASKKYKQKSIRKMVKAKPEFFENYSKSQIAEIISDIEIYSEIPHKYTYFNEGARGWHDYVQLSLKEGFVNTITNVGSILNLSEGVVIKELSKFKRINVLDLGCGDVMPIKNFLLSLAGKNILQKYYGLDISPDILSIARSFVKEDFKDINFEYGFEVRDFEKNTIQDLLFFMSNRVKGVSTGNLILLLGGTIQNHRHFNKMISHITLEIGLEDLIVLGFTLDSDDIKTKFFDDSNIGSELDEKESVYKWQEYMIPKLLGMKKEYTDVEFYFDEKTKTRKMDIICKYDFVSHIKNDDIDLEISLDKGQRINVWRHKHHSLPEIVSLLDSAGLDVMHVITSENKANALTICRRKPV